MIIQVTPWSLGALRRYPDPHSSLDVWTMKSEPWNRVLSMMIILRMMKILRMRIKTRMEMDFQAQQMK